MRVSEQCHVYVSVSGLIIQSFLILLLVFLVWNGLGLNYKVNALLADHRVLEVQLDYVWIVFVQQDYILLDTVAFLLNFGSASLLHLIQLLNRESQDNADA